MTLISRTQSELQAVAHELGSAARTAPIDVRDAAALADAVRDADREQRLDILVNSAGVNRPGRIEQVPLSDLELIIDTNLRGTLHACRAWAQVVLPQARGGAVVNLSSQMGSVGYAGRAAYCASKHAINGLTKALALEWAPHTRVNAVAPTFVETPFTAAMFEQGGFREEVMGRIPLARLATVDDVTKAILFLVSDDTPMVTGAVLAVDGGWTAI